MTIRFPRILRRVSAVLACAIPALAVFGAATIPAGPLVSDAAAQTLDGGKLVKVRVLSEKTHLVAGETNWVGLVFDVSREWHIYWRNPGGGTATTWELDGAPAGVTAGDAVWPLPERHATNNGMDFVHSKRAFIMVPIDVDTSVASGTEVRLDFAANWLVCKDSCVPGSGVASITLPVTDDPSKAEFSRSKRYFEKARETQPMVVEDPSDEGISVSWDRSALVINKPGVTALVFYPYENQEGVQPKNMKDGSAVKGDTLRLQYEPNGLGLVDAIAGVLVATRGTTDTSYEITVPLREASDSAAADDSADAEADVIQEAIIGEKAPDFALANLDGEEVTLSQFTDDSKIVVLEWWNPKCPFVNKHHELMTTMTDLAEKYKEEVVWLKINSTHNGHRDYGHNREYATRWNLDGELILEDTDGAVGEMYGATKTPHMYIVDSDGVLRYSGAIDNHRSARAPSESEKAKVVNYVDQALEQILAGEIVSRPETTPYGCGVKYATD